jgi:hypothetical protein
LPPVTRRRDDRTARRIEIGVYVTAGVTYVAAGFVLRSGVLNWVVGPAWFVAWVTLVTPLVLRIVGIEDPDGPGVALPDPSSFATAPDDGAAGADVADDGGAGR